MKKHLQYCFVLCFCLFLIVPMVTINVSSDAIAEDENRYLAPFPALDLQFPGAFEKWINDRIGFRNTFVNLNGSMMYSLFHCFPDDTDLSLGPEDELNYTTAAVIKDYQRANLFTPAQLEEITESYQTVYDALEEKGIQYYYFQCWDKHSIYPEQFPRSIQQYGQTSMTDQIVDAIRNTDVIVVSPKEELIRQKDRYHTYSRWGDPTHWTERGAYIGYLALMEEINRHQNNKYRILTEADYEITLVEEGKTYFGSVHQDDYEEHFVIKDPKAKVKEQCLDEVFDWADQRQTVSINEAADNRDTLLIMGDSYINEYILDDIAESFYRVVMMWGDFSMYAQDVIDYYDPVIVISENAERCERSGAIILLAENMNDRKS